jgi:hypothetical protein
MPILDSTAQAALGDHFAVAWYIFLDLDGDPLRVTTFGQDTVFSSTGDVDLDGNTFVAFGGAARRRRRKQFGKRLRHAARHPVRHCLHRHDAARRDRRQDQVAGPPLPHMVPALRRCGSNAPRRNRQPLHRLYVEVRFVAAPKGQTIQLSVENYLAYTTQASNRSYLNQKDYDAADTSAAATIAAANGLRSHSGGGGASSSTAGGLAGSYQTKPSGGDYYDRAGV